MTAQLISSLLFDIHGHTSRFIFLSQSGLFSHGRKAMQGSIVPCVGCYWMQWDGAWSLGVLLWFQRPSPSGESTRQTSQKGLCSTTGSLGWLWCIPRTRACFLRFHFSLVSFPIFLLHFFQKTRILRTLICKLSASTRGCFRLLIGRTRLRDKRQGWFMTVWTA